MLTLLDYLGTFAFAVSGALKGVRKAMDLFGLTVLAVVTAIGGGTLRDVLLEQRPFWLGDANYLLLSLLAVVLVAGLYRRVVGAEKALLWFDAVGLGTFTVIGADKAMSHEVGLAGTVVMACLTGCGGGMIRDLLATDIPVVLQREVYASAGIAGGLLYWFLVQAEVSKMVALPAVVGLVTVVRLLSLHYGWGLPRFAEASDEQAG
jgi:uncharacterized membrane protein YeiH